MAEVTRPSKATNDCAGQLLLESGIWDHEEDGHAVVVDDGGDDLNELYHHGDVFIHDDDFVHCFTMFYIVPLPWPRPLSESYKRLPLCDGPFWPWQPWRPIGHPRFGGAVFGA